MRLLRHWSGPRVRIRPCRASFRVWACNATRNAWRGGELPRPGRPRRARPPYACSGCPGPVRFVWHPENTRRTFLEHLRVIHGGVMVGDLDFAPALQRGKRHEYVGHAVTLVLVVVPDRLPRLGRDRLARLDDQLFRSFVQTNEGTIEITRLL